MRARVMEPSQIEPARPAAGASDVLLRHWDEALRQVNVAKTARALRRRFANAPTLVGFVSRTTSAGISGLGRVPRRYSSCVPHLPVDTLVLPVTVLRGLLRRC